MNIDIVIARYNENIDWSKQFDNVLIYNKGTPLNKNEFILKNIGRESHTYYTHIYNNYDKLNDYTIFLQGNPFDHSPHVIQKLWKYIENQNNLNIDFEFISEKIYDCKLSFCKHHIELEPFLLPTYNYLFEESRNLETDLTFTFGAGAQFIVSKQNILKKPKEFYLKIINLLNYNINPIEGFIIERFHNLILNQYNNIFYLGETESMLLFIYWMNNIKNIDNEHLDKIKNKYIKYFYKNTGYYDNQISDFDIIENLYSINEKEYLSSNIFYTNNIYKKFFSLILNIIKKNNFIEFNFNYQILNIDELNYLNEFTSNLNLKQFGLITNNMINNFIINKNILLITFVKNKIYLQKEFINLKEYNSINYIFRHYFLPFYTKGPNNNIFETLELNIEDILKKKLLNNIDTIIIDTNAYSFIIAEKLLTYVNNICIYNFNNNI